MTWAALEVAMPMAGMAQAMVFPSRLIQKRPGEWEGNAFARPIMLKVSLSTRRPLTELQGLLLRRPRRRRPSAMRLVLLIGKEAQAWTSLNLTTVMATTTPTVTVMVNRTLMRKMKLPT